MQTGFTGFHHYSWAAGPSRQPGLGAPNRFREFVHLRCRPLIVAIGTAGETACPTLLDQSFGEVGGAGGFACRWKLISIAIQSRKRLCTRRERRERSPCQDRRESDISNPSQPGVIHADNTKPSLDVGRIF